MSMLDCRKLAFALAPVLAVATAQQTPKPRIPYDGADAPNAPLRIYVDGDCRILPDPLHPAPGAKRKPYRDGAICSIEAQHASEHREERIDGRQLLRWDVQVVEEGVRVSDIADREAIFVVYYPVEKPWFIDSDPKPDNYEGNTAVYLLHVQPGESVGLHIGRRLMRPLKPKPL